MNKLKIYPLLAFNDVGKNYLIRGFVIDNKSIHFDYNIELENTYHLHNYVIKKINTPFNNELIFNGYGLVHKKIAFLFTESFEDNRITRNIILDIFKDYNYRNNINLDQNALITSTTSQHKNRFVYIVKEDEQYFVFIKKSIDNNAEILETIIFESEEETIEYIEKLEVQWLD